MMKKINMLSRADMAKGQGVLSAHDEQVALAKKILKGKFEVRENGKGFCEIEHYHTINPEYYVSASRNRKTSCKIGYVHFLPETVENSIKLPRPAKSIFYRYMISFYKKMDKLVTVNPCFIEKLERYGIPKERITYIPNVVSEKKFHPLTRDERQEIRRKYRIADHAFAVLCVGQMQKRKGIFDFVEIAEKMPECMFLWAGGFSFGKITDGYEEIKEMMKHLPSNVSFLGMVDREEMNEIYNMADVMFLPSYEELFPMTILESMNCGIPVLVRDLELYQPILFDYALRGKDREDFIRILNQLREDPEFYQRSAHASFAGHNCYSEERVGQMWESFYKAVEAEMDEKVWEKEKSRGGNQWKQRKRQLS